MGFEAVCIGPAHRGRGCVVKTIPLHAIDQIDRIGNEITTIWLALGNETDMSEDYLIDIREALNAARWRLREVRRAIEDADPA
jgi:hypothetical protein